MKRILLSSVLVLSSAAVLYGGSTGAFFSDSETSTGNTFTAGAIDLKVDNTSYYNGNKCTEVTAGIFQWQGTNPFPVPGTTCSTTWSLDDLDDGGITVHKFFDFLDLKPSDYSEDTISLHVDTNDAYLCANVTLTSNDDNTPTTPESKVDQTTGPGLGELAQQINFLWWADDGDNILEAGENLLPSGPLGALTLGVTTTVALADSATNIWTGQGGPVPGNQTLYIGKAWCFGAISAAPLPQAVYPNGPAGNNDGNQTLGQPTDGGYTCDGSTLGNETQTDSATVDVTFSAVQSRNNPTFRCTPPDTKVAKLTVTKIVVNNNGGNETPLSFSLFVDDGSNTTGVTSGVQATLPAGAYSVSEVGVNGYQASFSGDCDASGNVTLNTGDVKSCTITNTELPAHITLIKNVTGTEPLASNTLFHLMVDGVETPTGASVAVTSNTPHVINEGGRAGYSFVNIGGNPKCPAVLGGTATLDEGEAITCTITNNKNPQ